MNVNDDMEIFHRKMVEKGLKITAQRDEIARWIFSNHAHFTVDGIIEDFRKRGEKISIATTYRVVQMMLDLGLLIEHNFGREQKFYEHTPGHPKHDHMICTQCGKIQEFQDSQLADLLAKITAKQGFKIERYTLSIYGICNSCQKKQK